MYRLLFVLAFLLVLASPAMTQKRVALVIGNSAYTKVQTLANSKNDATAIANLLRTAGFDVVESKTDLGVNEMRRTLTDFSLQAVGADVAARIDGFGRRRDDH